MATEFQESLHDADVAFIDGDVQRCLSPFVPCIQIGAALRQQLHHGRLVAEGRVMNGPVAIFILQKIYVHTSDKFL